MSELLRDKSAVHAMAGGALDYSSPTAWGEVDFESIAVAFDAAINAQTITVSIVDRDDANYNYKLDKRAVNFTGADDYVYVPVGGKMHLTSRQQVRIQCTNTGTPAAGARVTTVVRQ